MTGTDQAIPASFDAAGEWADHFDLSIRSESTREKVVLSACYLDELLRQLVEVMLKPVDGTEDPLLDGPQAPLSTMSARIELAWRIGSITKEVKSSLHLVRKIRNKFAHSLSIRDFSDVSIREWNAQLHKLNDHATPERRAAYSSGLVGDFKKSVSWLVFWLRHLIQQVPSTCQGCGSEMEHRARIKASKPGEHA